VTDVENTESNNKLEVKQKFPTLMRMVKQLATEVQLQDREYNIESIMEQILSGESAEEIFQAQDLGSVASKDYIGRPFYLKTDGVTWMKSTLEDGTFPFYAMIRVRDLESEDEVTLNGGGASFVSVLWKLQDIGFLDEEKALVLESKKTSAGYEVVLVKPYALPKSVKAK
jgi:hypothetical protein